MKNMPIYTLGQADPVSFSRGESLPLNFAQNGEYRFNRTTTPWGSLEI